MDGIDIARTIYATVLGSALLVFIVAVVRLAMLPMPPSWQHPNVPPAMLPPMPKPPPDSEMEH